MRAAGLFARAAVVALVLTFFPPAGQVIVHANPETLTETLTDLPEAEEASGQAKSATPDAETATSISRSEVIDTDLTFNMLGITAPDGTVAVRARTFDDSWSSWQPLEFVDDQDGPDRGTTEDAASDEAGSLSTEPLWVGEATQLQIEVEGADVGDLQITLIDSMGSSGGPIHRTYETKPYGTTAEAGEELDIVSRAQWGADESLRSGSPSYATEVHMGVVHHTAHSPDTTRANGYSRAEAPGVMRAMYQYHTRSLGWSDLGYNVVVDRFGTVYEGRAGGFSRGVIGAHARGYNTGSFGVSIMGNFLDRQASSAAIESLTKVVGIKSAIHGIDPTGWTDQMGNGTWRPTILGHRDVGQTSCPGQVQQLLPQIRDEAQGLSMRFPDVATSSPHRKAILELADDGVTKGCEINAFCPRVGLNRAQASTFVMRAFDLDPVGGSGFSDVSSDFVHAPAINALAEQGWLIGYDDGTFRPNEEMTRGQLATLLSRAMELPAPMGGFSHYSDVSSAHAHSRGINALSEAGVRGNCGDDRFCPDDMALRDSTASFVNMVRHALDLVEDVTLPSEEEPDDPEAPDEGDVTDADDPPDIESDRRRGT